MMAGRRQPNSLAPAAEQGRVGWNTLPAASVVGVVRAVSRRRPVTNRKTKKDWGTILLQAAPRTGFLVRARSGRPMPRKALGEPRFPCNPDTDRLKAQPRDALRGGEDFPAEGLRTWKTMRRGGRSFANGWRFQRTSDTRQNSAQRLLSGPSSRTSFSAAGAIRTSG